MKILEQFAEMIPVTPWLLYIKENCKRCYWCFSCEYFNRSAETCKMGPILKDFKENPDIIIPSEWPVASSEVFSPEQPPSLEFLNHVFWAPEGYPTSRIITPLNYEKGVDNENT